MESLFYLVGSSIPGSPDLSHLPAYSSPAHGHHRPLHSGYLHRINPPVCFSILQQRPVIGVDITKNVFQRSIQKQSSCSLTVMFSLFDNPSAGCDHCAVHTADFFKGSGFNIPEIFLSFFKQNRNVAPFTFNIFIQIDKPQI